jgi:hypothetical protein
MTIYKLFKYCGGTDDTTDDESLVFENDNESTVVNKAIELSSESGLYKEGNIGIWNYRLERWENEQMVGGWRFFNNGVEFTNWIRSAILRK